MHSPMVWWLESTLWRRLGLRINETVMLDVRDWRPDLGEFGKLHVRFGKGARGRGPKARLVPAINGTDELIDWWLLLNARLTCPPVPKPC